MRDRTNGTAKPSAGWHDLLFNRAGTPQSDQAWARLEELVGNASSMSRQFFRQLTDPRVNIDDECGYPAQSAAVNVETYKQLYDRDAIACRVVQLMPKECWQVTPLVYEDEDSDNVTEFEKAWDELGKYLHCGSGFHREEEGSVVWEYLLRADILSGIGHFGILLLGLDDGRNLQDPVDGVVKIPDGAPTKNEEGRLEEMVRNADKDRREFLNGWRQSSTLRWDSTTNAYVDGPRDAPRDSGSYVNPRTPDADKTDGTPGWQDANVIGSSLSGTDQQYFGTHFGPPEELEDKPAKTGRKLLFLRAFDESLVQIVRYEWNVRSPRFGMPVMYRVTLNDPREQHTGVGLPLATVFVHWSRVVHIADDLGSSEIFGVPRMRPVLNRLLDLQKVYGADGECYWRNAVLKLFFETHPTLGGEVAVDADAFRNDVEQMMNGLQQWMLTKGISAKSIPPALADPTPHVAIQIEAVCIQKGCPVRVFKGSERGELASAQDDSSWNDRLRHRQTTYLTPRVIVPFIDRLIMAGVLPAPKERRKPKPADPKVAPPATPAGQGGKSGGGGEPAPKPLTAKPPSSAPPTGNVFPVEVFMPDNWNAKVLRTNADADALGDAPNVVGDALDHPRGVGTSRIRNSNPEGCNQHTGPGCGSGGLLSAMQDANREVVGEHGEGPCDVVAYALWKNLGKPGDAHPYRVQHNGEEHAVVLMDDGTVLDPTSSQYGQPKITTKGSSPYTGWEKFSREDLLESEDLLQEHRKMLRNRETLNTDADALGGVPRVGDQDGPDNMDESGTHPSFSSQEGGADEGPMGYSIEWPDLDSLSDTDKATVANTLTTALAAYVAGNVEAIISPHDFLTRVLKLDEEEATEIILAVTKAHAEQETMTAPPMMAGRPVAAPEGTQEHADQEAAAKAEKVKAEQFKQGLDAKTSMADKALKAKNPTTPDAGDKK